MAYPQAARGLPRDDPPYAGLGKFHAGGKAARIGHQFAVRSTLQVHGRVVCVVHVLEGAVLLHHKHLGAQLQDRIQITGRQGIKGQRPPVQPAHAGATAFSA